MSVSIRGVTLTPFLWTFTLHHDKTHITFWTLENGYLASKIIIIGSDLKTDQVRVEARAVYGSVVAGRKLK